MSGIIDDLQQTIRDFGAGRKNTTKDQHQNWKPDHVLIVRHRSCDHLHEQPII